MRTERQKEIERRLSLKPYLAELSGIAGRVVSPTELLSVEETLLLREEQKKITSEPLIQFKILFDDLKSESFSRLIEAIHNLNGSPVTLWLSSVIVCGALQLPSIKSINFSFPFNLISGEVLSISTDGPDSMLFDFERDDDGVQWVEVELGGPNWSKAGYGSMNIQR